MFNKFLFLLVSAFISVDVCAQNFSLDRLRVNAGHNYSDVVSIYSSRRLRSLPCSGILINHSTVITALHCIDDVLPLNANNRIDVVRAYDQSYSYVKSVTVLDSKAINYYKPAYRFDHKRIKFDLAVLELANSINLSKNIAVNGRDLNLTLHLGMEVIQVGFPYDISQFHFDNHRLPQPTSTLKRCFITQLNSDFKTLVTNCGAIGGMSGGAVFLNNEFNGTLVLIGLMTNGLEHETTAINLYEILSEFGMPSEVVTSTF